NLWTKPASYSVAPRAGAWIETCQLPLTKRHCAASRPARARGLKRVLIDLCRLALASRPARARGLKRFDPTAALTHTASRPARARGLKRTGRGTKGSGDRLVAPRAGAWIETFLPLSWCRSL